jgi:hypothetical protein
MATVYINLYDHLNNDLSLPSSLYDSPYQVECLKDNAPDDGEAIGRQGKFRIDCPEDGWKDVLEILRDSERSLVYTVVMDGTNGYPVVCEAGEMNSTVRHYTTRLNNAKHIFNFWFEDYLPTRQMQVAL